MKNVLVTGGAGFIGSHTADELIKRGYEVKILDSLERPVHMDGKPNYMPKNADFILGDVRNKGDWERALDGVQVVFHFAAYQDYLIDFSKFFHVNSVGTALLYEVAIEKNISLEKVIVASSQSVYGEGRYRCKNNNCHTKDILQPDMRSAERLERGEWEHLCPKCGDVMDSIASVESFVNPRNQYAVSKYTQELIGLNLGLRYDMPTTVLRYSIVQGPRQSFYNAYSGACRLFSLNHYFGRPPIIYEDGKQMRDFLNIEDAVSANMIVLENDSTNFEVYNVGGGRSYTIVEFAEIVKKAFGTNIKAIFPGEYRYGDTRHIFSDIGKLTRLGWKPKNTPKKSVEDYVKWLKSKTLLPDVMAYADKRMKEMNVVRKVLR